MSAARLLCVAGILLGSAACATTQAVGSARTLDPGDARVALGTELATIRADSGTVPAAQLVAGYRHGLAHGVELGVTTFGVPTPVASAYGASVDLKLQLHRAENPVRAWDVALVPQLGVQRWAGGGAWGSGVHGGATVLLGWNNRRSDQLVFGPRFNTQLVVSPGARPVTAPYLGALVGFRWHVGERLALVPQTSLMWGPMQLQGDPGGAVLWQGGLGLAFTPER